MMTRVMTHKAPLTNEELAKMMVWWEGREVKNGPYDDDTPRLIEEVKWLKAEIERLSQALDSAKRMIAWQYSIGSLLR